MSSLTPTLYAWLGVDAVVHDRMDDDVKANLTDMVRLFCS